MGQCIPDERYEGIVLRALPAEYERVRVASCERRESNLADLRYMVSTMYTDYLSRPDATNLVAGRGVGMQASGSSGDRRNHITCFICGKRGHVKRNCPARNAAKALTGGDKNKGTEGKWCSFHMSTTHSDEEC
ncbi:unnamed protein product, partial [Sphacelaria rigidula]